MLKGHTKGEKGFTLAELLIVVAIIGVLVAVSIPIFNKQLEKSREATDIANFRAAKASFIAYYITNPELLSSRITGWLYYDAPSGSITDVSTEFKDGKGAINEGNAGYGQGTVTPAYDDENWYNTVESYDGRENYKGAVIRGRFVINRDGECVLTIQWEDSSSGKQIGPETELYLNDFSQNYSGSDDGEGITVVPDSDPPSPAPSP